MKRILYIHFIIGLLTWGGCASKSEKMMSPNQSVYCIKRNELFVADETANHISIVNTATKEIQGRIKLKGKPGGLVLSSDESKLYVTLTEPHGELLEIDLSTKQIGRQLELGHTPTSPIISPDGKTLFVCNRFNNTISQISLSSFSVKKTADADREPISISFAKNKNLLFVANHLPSGNANAAYHSAKVSVFNATTLEKRKDIDLPNGSNSLHQITISPDEKFAYVTHILARYNVPTNQVERGWINTNALSIIDIENQRYYCTVMLDDLDLGAANPYDVACNQDGTKLFVSHTGTNELSIIDRSKLHNRIRSIINGAHPTIYASLLSEIQNDLGFLQDIRTRIKLKGKGAKGICLQAKKVFVSMYFSGSIEEIDLSEDITIKPILLGNQPAPTLSRQGEIFFNDATLCKQHWQSCSSCHPGDARVDGLNWDLLNDGIGNPKNTKSMLLAHATPPAMITGIRESAERAVRAGIEHILFTQQPIEVSNTIDIYLKSLKPVPSPYLKKGELSAAAKRGKKVFEKAGCTYCHSGPYYTNQESYNVGEGTGLENGRKFDTPSLTELWRTAPYLYDGKAKTVKEVLTIYNTKQKHGKTADLSEQEINDLEEYCLSL